MNENASNYSPQGRATLKYYLKRFEAARFLDTVLESAQFQEGYDLAKDAIKREEYNFQDRENGVLLIEFDEILQGRNRNFLTFLQEFCDSNSDVVEKIFLRRNCTVDDLMSVLLGETLPSSESVPHRRKLLSLPGPVSSSEALAPKPAGALGTNSQK